MSSIYVNLFLNSLSIIAIVMMIAISISKKHVKGGIQYAILNSFLCVWSIGSFMENVFMDFSSLLFWRNITQIGIFLTPIAYLYFTVTYTDTMNIKAKRNMYFILIFQLIAIILIFTDQYTHIMRKTVVVEMIGNLAVLKVSSTVFGTFAVGLNYIIIFYSLIRLVIFSRNTSGMVRNQSIVIIAGSLIPFLFGWLKSALPLSLDTIIPISAAFTPGCLFILWGIFKYDFMSISPIARNKIFDMVKDGIIVCTSNGRIIDFNIAASKIFEKANIKLDNRNINDYGRPELTKWFHNVIDYNESVSEFRLSTETGYKDYESQVFAIKDKKDHVVLGTISLIREITEIKKQSEELKARAYTDGLTGILNRNAFIGVYNSLMNQPQKNGIGMILIDIDHFKKVNDEHGHICGDEVLKGIVKCMENTIRDTDYVGRIGGEEFAIVLPNTPANATEEISERVRKNVENIVFNTSGKKIRVTISIGASHIADPVKVEFKSAFAYVDRLLYLSKNRGRNSVSFQKYEI